MSLIDGVPVFGEPIDNAVRQIRNVAKGAEHVSLMADHHLGYSMPYFAGIGIQIFVEEHRNLSEGNSQYRNAGRN